MDDVTKFLVDNLMSQISKSKFVDENGMSLKNNIHYKVLERIILADRVLKDSIK